MNILDYCIESDGGEALTVHDMGDGAVVLSSVNDEGTTERLAVTFEQLEAAVGHLRQRYSPVSRQG